MPDCERPLRELELMIASSPEEKAYIQGKHDGADKARKEVAFLFTLSALAITLAYVFGFDLIA